MIILARAVRLNSEKNLQDVLKQLLFCALNRKREFCTSFEYNEYPREQKFHKKRWDFSEHGFTKNNVTVQTDLVEFKKDFYEPHPDVLNRSEEAIKEFYNKNEIEIFGKKTENCPNPIFSFHELNLPGKTLDVIRDLKYSKPTPVQSQTWPIALSGHNMVGISRTGSGKTLGFVLPAIIHIKHQLKLNRFEGPVALMIAPTRELVQQIMKVIIPFANTFSFRVTSLFGGASKSRQLLEFRYGAELCVATPGRLLDVLREGSINLNRCTYFVLDEADCLLDMGFHPQISAIIENYSRKDKQILMWSATWPKEVRHLAEDFLEDYIAVKFGSIDLAANPNITQFVHVCQESDKPKLLMDILNEINKTQDNKTLIFCGTKFKVERISDLLQRKGFKVLSIHGDKSQNERDRRMQMFRSGRIKILVGTGIVGRGLDISDIKYVINYDFPQTIKDYVHIIGRTSRANNPGTSHTLFSYEERAKARELVHLLKVTKQEISPRLLQLAKS